MKQAPSPVSFMLKFAFYLGPFTLVLENSSLRKQPTKRAGNSILMARHNPDMESASDWSCRVGNLIQPIRSTAQIRVLTRHQYGISALVSQTSFGGKPVVASPDVGCFPRLRKSRLLIHNFLITIAIVSGDRDCCIVVSCVAIANLFPMPPFQIVIVYSDFQSVQNFFYRDVPSSVTIEIIVSRFPLSDNGFSTSPVLCPDLPPSLYCNYGISILASVVIVK